VDAYSLLLLRPLLILGDNVLNIQDVQDVQDILNFETMSGSSAAVRAWLQKQLHSSGIQIESSALKLLARSLDEITDPSSAGRMVDGDRASPELLLSALLDDVETKTDDRKLTMEFVEEFLRSWVQGNPESPVEVVEAFDVPLVQYDPIRHQWFLQNGPRSIIGDIKSKSKLYENRFLLIQQRLKRNALFRPSKWANTNLCGQRGAVTADLIELKALLGQERQRRFVCGFLTRHDEGQYFIEDLSARLPIDLSGCETADGLFTENCVVVAEGELQPSGEFRAAALGLPPAESREESIEALQGHDMFGAATRANRLGSQAAHQNDTEMEDDGDRIVVLSDVHLDDPQVMENLATVLDGFSAVPKPPSAFVLLGNFQTFDANGPRAKLSKIKENFTHLGRLFKNYPRIIAESQVVLVPGPRDIGTGSALPRRGIPLPLVEGFLSIVPNTILSSNPCRIRFKNAELVIFRADLQQKLRGLCILPPPMPEDQGLDDTSQNKNDSHASFFFDQTCSTVIQESHLCPVPLEYQPIAWEFDHAMYVYPNPHGLVLADSEPASRSIFDTCDCLNPGSLARGTFGAWNPSGREMELCDVSRAESVEVEEDGNVDIPGDPVSENNVSLVEEDSSARADPEDPEDPEDPIFAVEEGGQGEEGRVDEDGDGTEGDEQGNL
jgi:DNA polymerase epsilon subunit 2